MNDVNSTKPRTLSDCGTLLTVEEMTEVFGVSARTVYRLAESSELPRVKIGRRWYFPKAQLEKLFGCGEVA